MSYNFDIIEEPTVEESAAVAFELPVKNMNQENNPVLKLSSKGKILYANKAAFPLLKAWNCAASNKVPSEILSKNPIITDLESDTTIRLMIGEKNTEFIVVGFSDAGYIGLYGKDAASPHSILNPANIRFS